MPNNSHLELFTNSLERCLAESGFIPRFYRELLGSSDEVRDLFRKTDFSRHEERMEQSLRTLGGVMNGDLAALRHLNDRATSHNHHNLDVRPEFYPLWKDALLVSVQYYDPAFCPGIKEAWDVILDEAIRFMTKRY